MNQTLSYIIYISIAIYITIWVGKDLHTNGRFLIEEVFGKNSKWIDPINNMLLTGYYCLNLGLVLVKIRGWPEVKGSADLIFYLSNNIGDVLIVLGAIHSFNILVLTVLYYKNIKIKF